MYQFSYSPFDSFVELEVLCPFCGRHFKTEPFSIPEPDLSAETGDASTQLEHVDLVCPHCGQAMLMDLATSYHGGIGTIPEAGKEDIIDINITTIPSEEI